jgi:hypothetical protein
MTKWLNGLRIYYNGVEVGGEVMNCGTSLNIVWHTKGIAYQL